jgi:hypothetical protein
MNFRPTTAISVVTHSVMVQRGRRSNAGGQTNERNLERSRMQQKWNVPLTFLIVDAQQLLQVAVVPPDTTLWVTAD